MCSRILGRCPVISRGFYLNILLFIPFSPWLPFDCTLPIIMEIVLLVLGILWFIQCLISTEAAVLLLAIALLMWAQLKVLNSKMRSIRPQCIITDKIPDKCVTKKIRYNNPNDVVRKVDERTAVKLRPASTGKPVRDENSLTILGVDARSARKFLRRNRQQILLKLKKMKEDNEMERKLVECVKLHQALLRYCLDLISCYIF